MAELAEIKITWDEATHAAQIKTKWMEIVFVLRHAAWFHR